MLQQTRTSAIDEVKPWFHKLHLLNGAQTAPDHPPGDFPANKWRQLAPQIPLNLTGWSVIDIGCNALRRAARNASQAFHFAAEVALTTSLANPRHDFDVNASVL